MCPGRNPRVHAAWRGHRQAPLPQHPRGVQAFNNDAAVGLSQPCCQDVQVMRADVGDPAMQAEISVLRSR